MSERVLWTILYLQKLTKTCFKFVSFIYYILHCHYIIYYNTGGGILSVRTLPLKVGWSRKHFFTRSPKTGCICCCYEATFSLLKYCGLIENMLLSWKINIKYLIRFEWNKAGTGGWRTRLYIVIENLYSVSFMWFYSAKEVRTKLACRHTLIYFIRNQFIRN